MMDEREELMALRRMAELEAKEKASVNPVGTDSQNFAAGAGKALADTGRGAVLRSSQAFANAPNTLPVLKVGNMLLEKIGMSPAAQVDASKADIAASRERDAPLMDTKAGIGGNILGHMAVAAPAGGANTPASAGFVGTLQGLVQPALDATESGVNALLGLVGGYGGQWLATKAPAHLQGRVDAAKANQAANAQRFDAARAGAQQGYVVPPADLEPGMLSEAASGLSGKIKTAQVASQRNQGVTDRLVRQSLGVEDGTPLNAATLGAIRKQAGGAYELVASTGTVMPGKTYSDALDKAVEPFLSQAKSFPGRKMPPVVDDILAFKSQSFDARAAVNAISTLRDEASAAYSAQNKTVGKAYKQAAEALEQALDDHLVSINAPADLLKNYRNARQTIAKTYTVQNALNPQTGSVDATKLAADLKKGKPLSGEMKQVAEFSQAFPKATQSLKEAPKAISPLDWAVAGSTAVGTGNVLPLAMVGARPAVRNALLSGPVQARALQQTRPVPFTQATQAMLENELARALLAPVGIAAGANLGQ
jgi:hypothetical protein